MAAGYLHSMGLLCLYVQAIDQYVGRETSSDPYQSEVGIEGRSSNHHSLSANRPAQHTNRKPSSPPALLVWLLLAARSDLIGLHMLVLASPKDPFTATQSSRFMKPPEVVPIWATWILCSLLLTATCHCSYGWHGVDASDHKAGGAGGANDGMGTS